MFGKFAGIDPTDREPDVEIRVPGPEQLSNLEFFLTHVITARSEVAEHWDVIEDEVSREVSVSGLPMFGDTFPEER